MCAKLETGSRDVAIPFGGGSLFGALRAPDEGRALVIFAHGSGSGRHSPRNVFVARRLAEAGFGTLLLDLLTEAEDRVYENRFDIPRLASRLLVAVAWSRTAEAGNAPLAFFGASTGAAAALIAAAELGSGARAVVSRGGRPDLAGDSLARVQSPTLFIVGGEDIEVLRLNRESMRQMPAVTPKELSIVPGATHLFEEPGALEQVASLAASWLVRHAAQG